MGGAVDDLVTWLRAQLNEDERIARTVPGPAWEHRQIRGDFDESVVFEDYVAVADPEQDVVVFSDVSPAALAFVLRLDPARVLREIDAKRRIVDQCAYWNERAAREAVDPPKYPQPGLDLGLLLDAMNPVLRALALPYADRPGFQEEWRP